MLESDCIHTFNSGCTKVVMSKQIHSVDREKVAYHKGLLGFFWLRPSYQLRYSACTFDVLFSEFARSPWSLKYSYVGRINTTIRFRSLIDRQYYLWGAIRRQRQKNKWTIGREERRFSVLKSIWVIVIVKIPIRILFSCRFAFSGDTPYEMFSVNNCIARELFRWFSPNTTKYDGRKPWLLNFVHIRVCVLIVFLF